MRLFISMLTFILVGSQMAYANADVAGDWCKRTDEYTVAYRIRLNENGELNVKLYVLGEDGQDSYQGYWSIGGSAMEMYLMDLGEGDRRYLPQGISDYNRWRTLGGRDRLTLRFENYPKLVLRRCPIVYRKTKAQRLDEENSKY